MRPGPEVVVPEPVARIAGDRAVTVVWRNELGGLTFEVGSGPGRSFVKWNPASTGIDLGAEAARLRWAAAHVSVPRVLEHRVVDGAQLLVTAGLPGGTAVAERWTSDPATAVAGIGAGLRAFHDRVPVVACPFSWSVADRLAEAQAALRSAADAPMGGCAAIARRGLTAGKLIALAEPPPVDRLVVCHGDACAPNTLLDAGGRCTGHVDLGELGVADRWADLAVATWSLDWNFGPGWQQTFLAAYGVPQDPARIDYYRRLWEIGP